MRHACLPVVLALVSTLSAQDTRSGSRPNTGIPTDLLGCWRRDGDAKEFIRIEPTKVSFFRRGALDVYRACFDQGKLIVIASGMRGERDVAVREGALVMGTGKDQETYRRLDAVPEELVFKALDLGKDDPDAEQLETIRAGLKERARVDQEVRKDPARRKDMASVDEPNTAWLVAMVRKHGWIDATRFGRTAAGQAFLLVQHSGHVPLMMAALPRIEEDVKSKRVDPQDYALLCDRLRLRLGEKQLYGSQIGMNNSGEQVVLALEDPEHVEERRKAIGLFPLSEYLELFKKQNGGKDVKFEEDR